MKRPRIRLRWLILMGVVLLPPMVWVLLVSVAPTDWARQRFAARMSAATGRSVQIATVRVGVLGGIYLTGLEIGAPGAAGDPWLMVAQAHLNISPWQLVCGHTAPTRTEVRGINLRVLRRDNGTLELDDLIQGVETAEADVEAGRSTCPLSRLDLRIKDAVVTVIDAPTRTRLEFRDIEGRATSEGRNATIQELRGTLNGGSFEIVAQLDRSTAAPSFEGHLRARRIELNQGMNALGYLVPILLNPSGSLDGTLDIDLYLRGKGATRTAMRETVVGNGSVTLDPIHLDGSRFLSELAAVIELPAQRRVGSVTSDFEIKQGRILSENLTVSLSKLPVVLAGWTSFDGKVNYRLRGDGMMERLPGKARELLTDLSIDARDLTGLKIEGAIDDPDVTLAGVSLNLTPAGGGGRGEGTTPGDDRQRLREVGRRLRERILR